MRFVYTPSDRDTASLLRKKSMTIRVTATDALAHLPRPATPKWKLGVWDAEVLAHDTMSVSIFAPKETDF